MLTYCDLLACSDSLIFLLIKHYEKVGDRSEYINGKPVGGARAVATLLNVAASADPNRFYNWGKRNWFNMEPTFRENIIYGISNHIQYSFGKLSKTDNFEYITEPSAAELLKMLFDLLTTSDLEGISEYFIADGIHSCSVLAEAEKDIRTICALISQKISRLFEQNMSGTDYINMGINSSQGKCAISIMQMSNKWVEENKGHLPETLQKLLIDFASYEHPATRVMILYNLYYFQYFKPDLGWKIFELCTANDDLWGYVYNCLYYHYSREYKDIQIYLTKMKPKEPENWAALMTLWFLDGAISDSDLLNDLLSHNDENVWIGAMKVLIHNIHDNVHCGLFIEKILSIAKNEEVFRQSHSVFDGKNGKFCILPQSLISLIFSIKHENNWDYVPYNFTKWLVNIALIDTELVFFALEKFASFCKQISYIHDKEELVKTINYLFREAEENEENDNGEMLKRAIKLQDDLLERGFYEMEEWLKDVERP